jgi:hypothetical protein
MNQVTDVKGPDGVKTLHKTVGSSTLELQEMRKRFFFDAKRSYKEYAKNQKRSKMLQTKNGRYLIEIS